MKKLFLLLNVVLMCQLCVSQDSLITNKCWVIVANDSAKPNANKQVIDSTINVAFQEYNVINYKQAFPFAKTPMLKNVYEVECDCNIEEFISFAELNHSRNFTGFYRHYVNRQALYDPPDYLWQAYLAGVWDWAWHLDSIEAEKAWDITRGNPNIRTAIIDTDFDIDHPDLAGKINPVYDPYDSIAYDCTPFHSHGTNVAGLVAGETVEIGNTPNGIMASVGFSTMMIAYKAWSGNYLQRALHASTVMNANILTSSAGGWTNCPDQTGIEAAVVKEILDNGTVIVMPAGNGWNGTHNGSDGCPSAFPPNTFSAFFPLHPMYDERVIIVTSIGKENKHHRYDSTAQVDKTHSHFPEVDISSPGYDVFVAMPTNCNLPPYSDTTWPYYAAGIGTSYATPIVAGVVSLVLSVNPCLSPAAVQEILKTTTDPVADEASYSGLIGTGRVNAYRAVQLAQTYGTKAPITTNTTWSADDFINGDVIIESGATLTINNNARISLSPNSSIIVKPGAKLIVNGATLTNFCNKQWRGIVVQGTKTQPQDLSSNDNVVAMSTNQGFVYLIDATIENAYEALRIWNPADEWVSATDTNNIGGTGGIVRAVNTTFRNNRRSAEFMWYQSKINGREVANKSSFVDCTFTTDDEHLNDHPFSAHVTAWGVKDIKFLGCTFENATTISGSTNANTLGAGIGVIDAGIIVDDNLTGHTQSQTLFKRSHFRNLQHGVYVMNESSVYTAKVKNAIFENCLRGIRNEQVNLATFAGNEFTIGDNPAYNLNAFLFEFDEGIILHQATGFRVEQNTFTGTVSPAHIGIGIRADETGTANNRIYKNSFTQVQVGNMANRQNQFNDGQNQPTGLRYECNSNSDNTAYDISVVVTDITQGIRAWQGQLTLSAGNTFSHSNTTAESDFYNSGVGIDYFHDGTLFPVYKSASVNTNLPNGDPNECVANFFFPTEENPEGGGCITCLTYNEYADIYNSHKAEQSDKKTQYIALIDGGNTPKLLHMLDTAANANKLRDSLLSYSPNLSSTVLMKTAKNSLLNGDQKYPVLKNNAEGVTAEIISYLEESAELTNAMIDSIKAARSNLTARSYLLDELIYHTEQRAQANYGILYLIQEDTAGFDIYAYRAWLDSAEGLWAREEKVNSYLHEAKYDTALTLLAEYGETEIHNEEDSIAFKNYADYVTAYSSWIAADSSIMRLGDTQREELLELAELDEHKKGSNAARNILNFFYDSAYFTPAVLPEIYYGKKENNETNTPAVKQELLPKQTASIKLYPNPAQNSVTIEYNGIEENSKLYIVNVMGETVEIKNLIGSDGKMVLNTGNYQSGVYFTRISADKTNGLRKRFIILKWQ